MNLEKFTQKSQEALFAGQRLAEEHHHQVIEPVHLLLALLSQSEGTVPAIVTKIAGSVNALRDELRQELENRPKVYGGTTQVGLSPQANEVLRSAEKFAKGIDRKSVV